MKNLLNCSPGNEAHFLQEVRQLEERNKGTRNRLAAESKITEQYKKDIKLLDGNIQHLLVQNNIS